MTQLSGQIMIAAQAFPAPLIMLVMGIFYLWVYVRQSSAAHPQPKKRHAVLQFS
jgi:hypothetical protein